MARLQRWDPDTFLALMHKTLPDYERLQEETDVATGTDAQRILELGTGSGETTRRVLARHPAAVLVGLDASSEILDHARAALPADRVELRVGRQEDPLPDGPFDVIVSVLTVHHLDGAGKAKLFRRIADSLTPERTARPRRFRRSREPLRPRDHARPGLRQTQQHRRSAAVAHRRRPSSPGCVGTPRSRRPSWPRAHQP